MPSTGSWPLKGVTVQTRTDASLLPPPEVFCNSARSSSRAAFRAVLGRLIRGKLTLDDLWLLLPPLMLFATVAIKPIHPADFWWHLRTGQIIVESGHVPTTDLLSFTRFGQPWTNQGWLTQVGYYLLYRVGDLPLIILAHALLITAGYALIEAACFLSSAIRSRNVALGALAAMVVGLTDWGVRPQGASFLCFGLLVYMIERHRLRGGSIIWGLPVLFVLWGNLHGGFVFGLGLLAIYLAARVTEEWLATRSLSRDIWCLLIASGLAVLALAANPSGPTGIARYVAGFLTSSSTVNKNLEFQPLNIREADGLIFFVVTLLLLFVFWRRRAILPAYLVAAMVIFGLASLFARRIVPWFGMILGPTLAVTFAGGQPACMESRPSRSELNYLVFTLISLLAVAALPWLRPYLPIARLRSYVVTDVTPVQAAEELCGLGPDVRPFADISYASYLAWACPTMPIFMDTRFELYSPEMWADYIRIINGQFDWEARLMHYGVNALFVQKESEKELIAAATAAGGWRIAYEDEYAVLMRPKTTAMLHQLRSEERKR